MLDSDLPCLQIDNYFRNPVNKPVTNIQLSVCIGLCNVSLGSLRDPEKAD